MATYRVHKTSNYTVMSNRHLRDESLSLRAKGLLSVMLMLPDDWRFSVSGLASILKEGVGAVRSTLAELKDAGYVRVEKVRDEAGRYRYEYDIYEAPGNDEERPYEVEAPDVDEPGQEPAQEPKPEPKAKARRRPAKQRRFSPPAPEEVEEYARSIGFALDGGRFCDYYESRGWKYKGNVAMRDWKAAVRNWKRSGANDVGRMRSDEDAEWDARHGW